MARQAVKRPELTITNGPIGYWSFSVYAGHSGPKGCGYRQGLKSVAKMKEPGSAAMDRGTEIHDVAKDYVEGKGKALPRELGNFPEFFKVVRTLKRNYPASVLCEENWGFTREWVPCSPTDFKRCWLRIKADIAYNAASAGPTWDVVDYKTGQYRQDEAPLYELQLELQALGALIVLGPRVPDLRVRSRLMYLDRKVEHPARQEYALADVPRLKKEWERRVKPLLTDVAFKPRPGAACTYCHFRADNGGPCCY